MKKKKQPGDNISLKTKKSEDPLVMEWINSQSNLMDSLRYLIECEIVQNGVRNLQTVVPVERNVLGALYSESGSPEQSEAVSGIIETAAASEAPAAPTAPTAAPAAVSPEPLKQSVENSTNSEVKEAVEPVLPLREDAPVSVEPEKKKEVIVDDIDDDDISAWI